MVFFKLTRQINYKDKYFCSSSTSVQSVWGASTTQILWFMSTSETSVSKEPSPAFTFQPLNFKECTNNFSISRRSVGEQFSWRVKRKTNFSVLVSELDAQWVHGSEDGCQALDGVAVDHRLVLLHIIPREAIFVDNPAHTHTHILDTSVD